MICIVCQVETVHWLSTVYQVMQLTDQILFFCTLKSWYSYDLLTTPPIYDKAVWGVMKIETN